MNQPAQTPREIVQEVLVTWVPGKDPIQCRCGHPHYARVPQSIAEFVVNDAPPSTRYCEDETCACDGLKAAPPVADPDDDA